MKKLIYRVFYVIGYAITYLMGCLGAHAQYSSGVPYYPQTLPAQTLIGRYASSPGPTEAIPFALFNSGIGAAILAQTNTWTGANTFNGATVVGTAGTFSIMGSSSGTIGLIPQANSGTFNWNYPTTAGTSGYFLTSAGGGTSPMTWTGFSGSGTVALTTNATLTTPTISTPAITGGTIASNTISASSLSSDTLSGVTTFQGHQAVNTALPTLSSCGTSPAIVGNDVSGQVTMGTGTPTACTITFNSAYASTPLCNVTWLVNIASMQYFVSNTAITLTQTATSSNKVIYHCMANGN